MDYPEPHRMVGRARARILEHSRLLRSLIYPFGFSRTSAIPQVVGCFQRKMDDLDLLSARYDSMGLYNMISSVSHTIEIGSHLQYGSHRAGKFGMHTDADR